MGESEIIIYEPKCTNMPSVSWLIFNRHETDKRKARASFIARFGREKYDDVIKPIERAGIMSIFDSKPNSYTAYYVNVMAESVDKRALRREATEGSKLK